MKKILALLLTLSLVFTACMPQNARAESHLSVDTMLSTSVNQQVIPNAEVCFTGLSDPAFLRYVEDSVYENLIQELDNDSFFVENVSAIYVSKEYLDELAYNSQANIYFGYTLSALEEQFQGTKYIFTLGENGKTVVQEFEKYDDTYDKVIRNVAIGTGVILLCVTVSVVTAGVGATAVSVIFAASAKTAAAFALSGGIFSGVTAGIVTGIQTKDFGKSLKAAALAGSDGFMWGAITGTVAGGYQSAMALKGATLSGLTMNQAAVIQRESKYPLDIIKQFKSMDEYRVYQSAGLKVKMINGKAALAREIDLDYISDLGGMKVTNLFRMQNGYAPIDPVTGKAYQLHHVAQNPEGTLAVLTEAEHQGNSAILNIFGKDSEIDRNAFASIRKKFWESYASTLY